MTRRLLPLVPCLAIIAAVPAAEGDGFRASSAGETGPGRPYTVGQGRQVIIQGLIDLDAVNRGQYLSGNRDVSDHAGYGYGRAELAAKVKPDEQTAVVVGVAYQDESGETPPSTEHPDRSGHYAVVNQAYVDLRDVLGFESFGLLGGRMPVNWNLRHDRGSFLYDSRADHQLVTSWDGAQVSLSAFSDIHINPFIYAMPDSGSMFGIETNWEPAASGDTRFFITGMATWERKTPNRTVDAAASSESRIVMKDGDPIDSLATYDIGFSFQVSDVEIYAEGAMQRGKMNDAVDLRGLGGYTGLEWAPRSPNLVLGIQLDYRSGESDAQALAGQAGGSGVNHAFIDPWEGVSDLYIVENEKYGELSNYLSGAQAFGTQILKARAKYTFDDRARFWLEGVYGYARTDRTATSQDGFRSGRTFGQEIDLTFGYRHNNNTSLRLFGGMFLPREGFTAVAPGAGGTPARDIVYLVGGNLKVEF